MGTRVLTQVFQQFWHWFFFTERTMEDDQQFCLRWNNHQSTLVAVFDTLLENGTLVDCTLAAEGKCLNAHKVVLSACSPFFEVCILFYIFHHVYMIVPHYIILKVVFANLYLSIFWRCYEMQKYVIFVMTISWFFFFIKYSHDLFFCMKHLAH